MRLVEIDKGLYVNLDFVWVIQFCAQQDDKKFYFRFGFGAKDQYTYFLASKSFKTKEEAEKWFEDFVLPLIPNFSLLTGEFKIERISMKLKKEV